MEFRIQSRRRITHLRRRTPEFTGRRAWVKPYAMQSTILDPNEARIAELVRAYIAAEYRCELGGDWLNLRIGETAPDVASHFPDAAQFGLLSAWDPWSIQRPEAVNRDADEALQRNLLESGRVFRPAFSSATNRSWREPSWLVMDMPVAEFDALSRRYGQLATLCWSRFEPVRLRVDATRPFALRDHPACDWLRG
jgi:Protein of unknown function (DUF3293)